jgi:predicted nuclease of predicted toxin-antitoxin system
MKLLFDQNISFRISKKVADVFGGCQHVTDVKLEDAEDLEIWQYAKDNEFAIVTFDADYYDIALLRGVPPKIIWLRVGNITTSQLANILKANASNIEHFLNNKGGIHERCLEIV